MPNTNGFLRQQESLPEEEFLYNFLLDRVKQDSPLQLLEDFSCLFIQGGGFRETDAYFSLERVVRRRNAEEFIHFFNRCCHILINYWQMYPKFQSVIPQLVSSLENLPPPRSGSRSTANQLRHLVREFAASDQYVKLQRIARTLDAREESKLNSVCNLIHRYPYLYDHYLVSEDSISEHQQTVRNLKSKIERDFEVNLSQYVTYQVRLGQSGRTTTPAPATNPTLLGDRELNKALKQFIGKVEGGYTYRGLSHKFLVQSAHIPNFRAFKDNLFQYLSGSLDSPYGQSQLSPKLHDYLQNLLPESNSQQPSELLMLRTSSQLLNFLVVESASNPQHYLFVDMVTNLGVTRTVGLLLKLVLICRKVKPYLDKRFSILFNHYESYCRDEVPWLVKALEYIQIASSIHFGRVNLSGLS